MADLTFNTTAGETIAREALLLCLNTGSASTPTWSPCGKRTTDSSMEIDWGEDTATDVLGVTRTPASRTRSAARTSTPCRSTPTTPQP